MVSSRHLFYSRFFISSAHSPALPHVSPTTGAPCASSAPATFPCHFVSVPSPTLPPLLIRSCFSSFISSPRGFSRSFTLPHTASSDFYMLRLLLLVFSLFVLPNCSPRCYRPCSLCLLCFSSFAFFLLLLFSCYGT